MTVSDYQSTATYPSCQQYLPCLLLGMQVVGFDNDSAGSWQLRTLHNSAAVANLPSDLCSLYRQLQNVEAITRVAVCFCSNVHHVGMCRRNGFSSNRYHGFHSHISSKRITDRMCSDCSIRTHIHMYHTCWLLGQSWCFIRPC